MTTYTKYSPEVVHLRMAASKAKRAARKVARGEVEFMGSMPAAKNAGYSLETDRIGYAVFSEIFLATVKHYFPNGIRIIEI